MSGNLRASQGGDPAQADPERFHSLDALRAFALLLGVLFHAAESFEPGVGSYWAVEDCSTSGLLWESSGTPAIRSGWGSSS